MLIPCCLPTLPRCGLLECRATPWTSLVGEAREFTFYPIIRAMGVALVEYSSGVHRALNTSPKKKKRMEGRRQKQRKGDRESKD